MNRQVRVMFLESLFFFVAGVILASFFIWSMVQGVLLHTTPAGPGADPSKDTIAFGYYFVGWVSGVAALALYWQAKNLFHYAEISK